MSQQLTVQEERANRLASFKSQLEKQTPAFAAMLPAHIPVEKFKRVVMTAIINGPDILECTAQSIFTACARAAADGLLPDGREGAIVKFKDKAQWMPMVGGILKKIRNSGEILTINAYVVYRNDKFRYVLGDDEKIEHTPYIGDGPGEPIAVYAIARTKDGGVYREVMTKAQVEKVRAVSRSDTTKPDSPWVKWWDEKARVAVTRRLSKRLPMSTDREEDIRSMLEREDEPDMQDVTTSAGTDTAEPRPTRADFTEQADAAAAGQTAATPSGGDNVKRDGNGSAPVQPSRQDAEPTEIDERKADRMMAAAQAGGDPAKIMAGEADELVDPIAALETKLATRAVAILTAIERAASVRELDKIQLAQRGTLDDISAASPAAHEAIMAASRARVAELSGA